jgi:hypothetical protein
VGGGVFLDAGEVAGCTIRNNIALALHATSTGGGVQAQFADIHDCSFENNRAGGGPLAAAGGGLYVGSGTVSRCVFRGNIATAHDAPGAGGGLACTRPLLPVRLRLREQPRRFRRRRRARRALCDLEDDSLRVTRCTFANNQVAVGGVAGVAAETAAVYASIFAFNDGAAVEPAVGTFCSDFFANAAGDSLRGYASSDCFSADPLFCDPPLDFHLGPASPCAPGQHPVATSCGRIGALDVGCASTARPSLDRSPSR